MSPYSNYSKYGRTCVVLNEKSKRYSKYIRYRHKYNIISLLDSDWKTLEREEARLAFKI